VSDQVSVVVLGAGRLPGAVVRRAVRTVLSGERRAAHISVTFLGQAAMQRLNREYKRHDRPTDVIAFALPQPDGTVAGDVYLCRGVAAREAHHRSIPVRQELLRLVIHGTLHVLGHDHPEDKGRERSSMWKRQERYLRDVA
jgi:probable rRNA maturation factor